MVYVSVIFSFFFFLVSNVLQTGEERLFLLGGDAEHLITTTRHWYGACKLLPMKWCKDKDKQVLLCIYLQQYKFDVMISIKSENELSPHKLVIGIWI